MTLGELTGQTPQKNGEVRVVGGTFKSCEGCGDTYPVCKFNKQAKEYECGGAKHKNHLRDLYFKAIGELVHVPNLCKHCYRQGFQMLKADRDQYLLLKAGLEELRREERRKAKRQNTRKKNRRTINQADELDYEAKLVAEELAARAKADKKFKAVIRGKRIKGADFTEKDLAELEAEMLKPRVS
jgi:hypothetical protein